MGEQLDVDCCVVGGGPAGVMAGLLFARAGAKTVVLEKHADFLRDFRGDTVHPSTLELMHELGILEAFLARPHQQLSRLSARFGDKLLHLADFSHCGTTCKFIALMPQWHFLDFLNSVAEPLPTYRLRQSAEVTDLIFDGDRVAGVHAETAEGPLEVRAKVVIGADGRGSLVRDRAGFQVEDIGAPIDVLWFKVPRPDGFHEEEPLFNMNRGSVVITIDRGSYFQCAFVIPKGAAERVKGQGPEHFRSVVVTAAPHLAGLVDAVTDLDDVKLLTVTVDRLKIWSRPGLLMIGDSAHAMSPIGGVGINLAVQDAVAAANLLAGPLAAGEDVDPLLPKLRERRLWPIKATQFVQVQAQNRLIAPALETSAQATPPLPARLASRLPFLQRRLASVIGVGVLPEHIHSPEKYPLRTPQ
ncbi:FAD-dependent oxidoreductase [Roseibium aggregatum]|uniref:FAD-dependent oxidoreductase n=1 Tax=Roseibium aggregatum TaxID=187304 RepID=A0A926S7T8_9HYPH|nr:FAD-dependent oxidoreductase [Roseibium aggregatum]MBD1548665.1 FAD-dependent oxidoreductase [Roseibium aggregatum]